MRILIAGSGKVGLELTRLLSAEGHDITLVDRKQSCLQSAIEKYDVMTVEGNAASLDVLNTADVQNADLLIATTGLDEINMLACVTARQLNPRIHTIARIRNPEYKDQVYLMKRDFGLSLAVNPELEAATE
ncbi:MAG: NAD-binding protein, partial [Erysipelotrichales bacterium]|nr:NAD-binding protein [Erysipelotrichales bacterium]